MPQNKRIIIPLNNQIAIISYCGGIENDGVPNIDYKGGFANKLEPNKTTIPRLQRVEELYLKKSEPWVIISGGIVLVNNPYHDKKGHEILESRVDADYLIKRGMPKERINVGQGHETLGETSITIQKLRSLKVKQATVVTSQFHMPRVEYAINYLKNIYGLKCKFKFEEVENKGLRKIVLQERIKKETESLESLKRLSDQLTTEEKLTSWFGSDHKCYDAIIRTHEETNTLLYESY